MTLRNELKELLADSYAVVNELQIKADIDNVKKELLKQSHEAIKKLEGLSTYLHEIVNLFDLRAKDMVDTITSSKMQTLDNHSYELLQFLEYLSKMCVITEDLLKLRESSTNVEDFAPKLKDELSNSIRDCKELLLVDYDLFTSLDVNTDTAWLFKTPFVDIISRNSQNEIESKLCSIGFEDSKNFKEPSSEGKSGEVDSGLDSPKQSDLASMNRTVKFETNSFSQQNFLSTIPEGFDEVTCKPESKASCDQRPHLPRVEQVDVATDKNSASANKTKLSFTRQSQEHVVKNQESYHADEIQSKSDKKQNYSASENRENSPYGHCSEQCPAIKVERLSHADLQASQLSERNVSNNCTTKLPQKDSVPRVTTKSNLDYDLVADKDSSQTANFDGNRDSNDIANKLHLMSVSNIPKRIHIQQDMDISKGITDVTILPHTPTLDMSWEDETSQTSRFHSLLFTNTSSSSVLKSNTREVTLHSEATESSLNTASQPACQYEPGTMLQHIRHSIGKHSCNTQAGALVQGFETNDVKRYVEGNPHNLSVQVQSGKETSCLSGNSKGNEANSESEKQKHQAHSGIKINSGNSSIYSQGLIQTPFCKDFRLQSQYSTPSAELLDVHFNIGSFITWTRNGIPEINAAFKQTITGGTSTRFHYPIGCCLLKDGRLVVADTGTNTVKILLGEETQVTIGKKDDKTFLRPSAVVADSKDNIYVKDDLCVQIFDTYGRHLKTIGMKIFRCPYGLALTNIPHRGLALFILDAKMGRPKLYRYLVEEDSMQSCDYKPLTFFGTKSSKLRFFAVHDDKMLASDLGASAMYLSDLDGEVIGRFGNLGYRSGQFIEPSGVAADAMGHWLVADSRNNRVQVFTNQGEFMAHIKFSQPIRRPSGIHLSSDGTLYVINYLDHCIKVYTLTK